MDLTGWTPARILWRGERPTVEWRWTGGLRFDDPFFEQTVMRAVRRPFSLLFPLATPIEALRDEAERNTAAVPSGFVFHWSRCGSTLVSQMLAADSRTLVLSEPAPVDGILRARLAGIPDETTGEWLQWLVAVLGRPLHDETAFVVKLDSWATLDLPLFEQAFPETPWAFVYRDPAEILASHLRNPGPQMLPGVLPPGLVGLDYGSLAEISLEEYSALVLARIAAAALERARSPLGLLVEYTGLPEAVLDRVAPHFHLRPGEPGRAAIESASSRDAKNPALPFEPDSQAKQRELGDAAREIVERQLRPVYEQLEAVRLAGAAC